MTAHLLEIDDLDPARLESILDRAIAWKAEPARVPQSLAGVGVAAVFEKPSARTRVSVEMAVHSLGGRCIYLRGDEVGIGVRESVADVTRTLASFCGILAARVFDHAVLVEMAAVDAAPVVNLLSDQAHPCQALADLLTLKEHFGSLDGRRLVYVGDGNNVAASLAFAAALSGIELVVSSPSGYELDVEVVDRARNLGGSIETVSDPFEAVRDADAIYSDAFFSMGQEDEAAPRRVAFAGYQANADLLAAAPSHAIYLHCLPAHRGEEVTDEVLDGPRSVVWQQAANRMHALRPALVDLAASTEAGAG